MGDCQNYGLLLGPYYNTGPNTGPNLGDSKRTIILTIPHVAGSPLAGFCHTLRTKLLPASECVEAPAMRHVRSVNILEAVSDSSFSHCRL